MVVLQRSDVSRHRAVSVLAHLLSLFAIAGIVLNFSGASDGARLVLALFGGLALATLVMSAFQIYGHPRRSQVLIFQNDDEMVIATNAVHEGFKLRFLRDILGENVSSFSDEDRLRWKALESDGYYPALYVRNVRKLVLLRLCTMIFDDVFVADRNNRWEHHDSSSTAEPTSSKREMPRLTNWKSST
jgi:hypothetical protein